MAVNKLKLNDSKTELFVAASAHNLRSLPNVQLDVGGTLISPLEKKKKPLALYLILACRCLIISLTSVLRLRFI